MTIHTSPISINERPELFLPSKLLNSGWQFAMYTQGKPRIVRNQKLDDYLFQGGRLKFSLSEQRFEAGNQDIISERIEDAKAKGKSLFNSDKIRLDTDPEPGKTVECSMTDYFQGLATNEMTYKTFSQAGEITLYGTELAYPDQLVQSLQGSRLSNHIGASALAFDSEGVLSLALTGKASMLSAQKITASAAGSCDLCDFDASQTDFNTALLNGVIRELEEEQGVSRRYIVESRLVAFHRDLERGGKPDFLSLIKLSKPWKVVRNELSDEEKAYTTSHVEIDVKAIGLNGLLDWASGQGDRISFTLAQNLFAITEFSKRNPSVLAEFGIALN